MDGQISSYGSLFPLGHRALANLFDGAVDIQEKVDGSQFSFGMKNGQLLCRSKGQQLDIDAPEKMFSVAVTRAKSIQHLLPEGWTFRGEYLRSPKHNTLAYDRAPRGNIILFDIDIGNQDYLSYEYLCKFADALGLDVVPLIYQGPVEDAGFLKELLNRESILGGQKIEGIVIKNYEQYGPDKKVLMAKYVSEAFKEIHGGEWRKQNPTKTDIVEAIIAELTTPARWNKAIQHLKEDGKLLGTPADIGNLIKEVQADVLKEGEDHIKQRFFDSYRAAITRGVVRGLPEWYKEQLMQSQFDQAA